MKDVGVFLRWFRIIENHCSKKLYNALVGFLGKDRVEFSNMYYDSSQHAACNILASILYSVICSNSRISELSEATAELYQSVREQYTRDRYSEGRMIKFIELLENKEIRKSFLDHVGETSPACCDNRTDGVDSFNEDYISPSYITIHFPETKVESDNGTSTVIYDYYLRLPMLLGRFISILGTKLTYTPEQLLSGYLHSHRPPTNWDDNEDRSYYYGWWRHCLGDYSTPLNKSIELLESININYGIGQVSDSVYRNIAIQIRDYIEVESIEGGPYMEISSIVSPEVTIKKYFDEDSAITHYVNGRINELDYIKTFIRFVLMHKILKFTIIAGQVRLIDCPQDLLLKLSKLLYCDDGTITNSDFLHIRDRWSTSSFSTLAKTTADGILVTISRNNSFNYDLLEEKEEMLNDWFNDHKFYFKGELKSPKVITNNEDCEKNTIRVLDNYLFTTIIKVLLETAQQAVFGQKITII